jgi:hypothetical protein
VSTPRPDDELSFHFRLDRRLAARANRFVFSVTLEGGGSDEADKSRGPTMEIATASASLVTWCLPPMGNPLQSVRAADGGVCVLGNATMFGTEPDYVVGKVYAPPLDAYPDNPPADAVQAQLVNVLGQPTFSPPSPCGAVNFVFHPTYGNELTGAAHSTTGKPSDVVVWLLTGSAVSGPHIAPFRGVTAASTECSPGAAPPPSALAMGGARVPANLSLTIDADFLAGPVSVTLQRKDAECNHSETVWASCAKAHPEMRWKLWVMHNNGQPYAVVSLAHLFGTRLEAPLVWRAQAWSLPGENQFLADLPGPAQAKMPVVTISD